MISTGLVSVTFRQLQPSEIVQMVSKAGLSGIEWGGDIHVPHGDLYRAREVYKMTSEEGLAVAAYGSYYRVGCETADSLDIFKNVVETAVTLKAPVIRVWAGAKGSAETDESEYGKLLDCCWNIADLVQKSGVSIAFEYHSRTLTDSSETTVRLLKEIDHSSIRCYWQPPVGISHEERLKGLNDVLPWLGNVHAFCWEGTERKPLEEGSRLWRDYLEIISKAEGHRYCMLEFVKDDHPGQFYQDAEVLKRLVAEAGKEYL